MPCEEVEDERRNLFGRVVEDVVTGFSEPVRLGVRPDAFEDLEHLRFEYEILFAPQK